METFFEEILNILLRGSIFSVLFLFVALYNWVCVIFGILKIKQSSIAPFIGGIFGMLMLLVSGNLEYFWVVLLLDTGSGLMIFSLILSIKKGNFKTPKQEDVKPLPKTLKNYVIRLYWKSFLVKLFSVGMLFSGLILLFPIKCYVGALYFFFTGIIFWKYGRMFSNSYESGIRGLSGCGKIFWIRPIIKRREKALNEKIKDGESLWSGICIYSKHRMSLKLKCSVDKLKEIVLWLREIAPDVYIGERFERNISDGVERKSGEDVVAVPSHLRHPFSKERRRYCSFAVLVICLSVAAIFCCFYLRIPWVSGLLFLVDVCSIYSFYDSRKKYEIAETIVNDTNSVYWIHYKSSLGIKFFGIREREGMLFHLRDGRELLVNFCEEEIREFVSWIKENNSSVYRGSFGDIE